MVPVAVLLVTATTFWAGAAPGVIEERCPDGVLYNVKPATQMVEPGRVAEATLGSCVITFRQGWRRTVTDRGACKVVLHEVKHAAIQPKDLPAHLVHEEHGIMQEQPLHSPTPAICLQYGSAQAARLKRNA